MYEPKHRAPRRRPTRQPATLVVAATAVLALGAVLGPAAYAGDGGWSVAGKPGKPDPTPGKPKDKPDEGKPGDEHAHDPSATNGGHALPGDAGAAPKTLTPTAPPATPYEMPFPCGEVWTGSTRAGHSPSVRSVDFNYAGGDQGKPVLAAATGTVITAVVGKDKPSYGQYVVLDHGNGESTLYGHMDSVLVAVGQPVTQGQQIGTVGNTGNSRGSHLHFEERVGGAVVDAWFHGAVFPMGSSAASQNCGGVNTPTPTQLSTDIPLAGDMYGGKSAEVAVYRRSAPAAFHITRTGTKERVIKLGDASAQPLLGDWDGNGRVEPGVRNPTDRVFTMKVKKTKTTVKFGKKTDVPVAGNWDGVGAWEVGVWRPSRATFLLRTGQGTQKVRIGDADDVPVTGDWNGDGTTDLGVYDRATATFTLMGKDPLGAPYTISIPFGTPGDLPVTGDWDGNGLTDLGVWSPVTATFTKRGAVAPTATTGRVKSLRFGRPTGG